MKKRLIAFMMCVTMCFAPVVEAGAAADGLSDIAVQQETESFDVEVVSEASEVIAEEFVAEAPEDVAVEMPEEVVVPEAEAPVEELPSEEVMTGVETPEVIPGEVEEITDLFSSGVSAEDVFTTEEEMESAGDIVLAAGEVLASQWKQDPATSKWSLKDYKNYYGPITTKDAAGNVIHDAAVYYFDAAGYMVTGCSGIAEGTKDAAGNIITELPKEFFFTDEANAKILNETDAVATPWNSNLGQQQKDCKVWVEDAFHFYGADGEAIEIEAKKVYEINGDHYYLLAGGKPKVGTQKTTFDGNEGYYYFKPAADENDIPGKMLCNKWAQIGNDAEKGPRYWFFQKNGVRQSKGIVAARVKGTSEYYLVDKYGYLIKGKMKKAANGYYYASDANGLCYIHKLVKIGNYRYYFGGNGRRTSWKNKWAKCSGADNRYYYFGSVAGRVAEKKGWQKVTSGKNFVGWFYFGNDGNHYTKKWSGDRYFLEDGRLASGVVKVGSQHYFFERSSSTEYKGKRYKKTWVNYNNKWYYATAKGPLLVNRWTKVQGYWYNFDENGAAKTNQRGKRDGVYGWLDERGRFTTEWLIMNDSKNIVRYMDPKTGKLAKDTAKEIDGLVYHFDSNGNRISDVTKTKFFAKYQGSYYLECDRINGVMTVYNRLRNGARGNVPLKTIRVSVGNPWTPTRVGTFRLTRSLRWQPLMGPSWGQYGTHVSGGIYVHSIACTYANNYNLPVGEYLKLGSPASHGCIRCCVADAKWVYDNCNGSTIRVFDGTYVASEAKKGPLGRNPLTPLRGAGNFDPTDPEVP